MITNYLINKLKGYVGLANKAGYLIWGVDNLKGYTHKLFLILYRSDVTNTIQKTLNSFGDNITKISLDVDVFNNIMQTNNSKIVAVKNKGFATKIIEILRGEDGR